MSNPGNDLSQLLSGAFSLMIKMEQSLFKGTRYDNLTLAEIHTIEAIGEGEHTMGEVAAALSVTLATLNVSVTRLCRKDYVQRRRTEEDRRRVLVTLTRSGRVVYRLHKHFHERMVREIEMELNECEQTALLTALNKIMTYFDYAATQPPREEPE